MWYRFWKTVHGHLTLEGYHEFGDDFDDNSIKEYCENWADNDSSGNNVDYKYGFQNVKKPPKTWLIDKLKYVKNDIKNNEKRLKDLKYWADIYSKKAKINKIKDNIKSK